MTRQSCQFQSIVIQISMFFIFVLVQWESLSNKTKSTSLNKNGFRSALSQTLLSLASNKLIRTRCNLIFSKSNISHLSLSGSFCSYIAVFSPFSLEGHHQYLPAIQFDGTTPSSSWSLSFHTALQHGFLVIMLFLKKVEYKWLNHEGNTILIHTMWVTSSSFQEWGLCWLESDTNNCYVWWQWICIC